MKSTSSITQGYEKEFLNTYSRLCYVRSTWQVWADIITAIACSLSNAADRTPEHFTQREKEYEACIKRIGSVDKVAELLGIIVMALEHNPDQDFLGKMYMNLELGNHWKGQFFTPYDICRAMAEITMCNVEQQVEKQGYITVNDPACGAGATLIAMVNLMRREGVNYQKHALVVGQDIDRIVGLMCYIQLTLLGCSGYITIADTLTNPVCGSAMQPYEKENQEFWYMPMYFSDVWKFRRLFHSMDRIIGTGTNKKPVEKEHFYVFFDFEEEKGGAI